MFKSVGAGDDDDVPFVPLTWFVVDDDDDESVRVSAIFSFFFNQNFCLFDLIDWTDRIRKKTSESRYIWPIVVV